jgi:hypothetical protein
MQTKTLIGLVTLLFLAAGLVLAASIDGKWVASMPGRDGGTMEMTFTFKADGSALTGTVGGMGEPAKIENGKIDGNSISFTVKREFGGNAMVMSYKGTVAGDEIKMTSQREGSDRPPREFTAKRAK